MKRSPAIVLCACALAVSAGCGSSSSSQPNFPTAPVAPTISSAPTQTAAAPTATATATATTSAPASPTGGAVVTGAGSSFTAPAAPTVKTYVGQSSSSTPCYGLSDSGYGQFNCQRYTSKLGIAVAVVESKGADERSLVYTISGNKATLALRSTRQLPSSRGSDSTESNTEAEISDLSSDNTQKVVFLTPQGNTTDSLSAVDVVEASGKVVIHQALSGGKARKALGGGLETFVPTSGGQVVDTIIQFKQGAWRTTSKKTVASSSVPDTGSF